VSFSETEILQKALQKDDGAFAELVEKYQSPVYNLCFRMLGSEVEAEDAAQETFWRAYQALNRYDPNRSFITWLPLHRSPSLHRSAAQTQGPGH